MTLDEQLCFALYSATNAIVRTYRPFLREIGLTYPQYLVLLVIWQGGEQSMGSIAAQLALPPGGVTPVVERLEHAGLLTRRRDPADRRIVYVDVTKEGAALETAAIEAQRRVVCATAMDPAEMDSLREILAGLTSRLNNLAPEAVPA